jgi:hypothetical protein
MEWQRVLDVLSLAAAVAGGYYAWRALDDRVVKASQEKFRSGLDEERERFAALNESAAVLHVTARPSMRRIGNSCMLIEETMEPAAPMPLSSLQIEWIEREASPPPSDPEFQRSARRTLPKQTRWKRFESYSAAHGALKKPKLWENRFCFRIVSADWRAADGPRLVLGEGFYFNLIDQSGPLTMELSAATQRNPVSPPAWRRVPLRARLKSDPLALGRRVVLASVGTLTVRRTPDGQGEYFALHRETGATAFGDNTYNVLPGGMLQPASISPQSRRSDLSVWRNIMREYNEEMLGAKEAIGDAGSQADYTHPPYSDFEQALADGTLRVWTFGMGVEALILTPVLLTIAVFEAHTFDSLFAAMVPRNEEGTVITKLPLRDAEVDDFLKSANVASPLAALLYLALQHRDLLLSAPIGALKRPDLPELPRT